MSAQSQSRSRKIGPEYDRKHACLHPGCRKSFTRAEHLRRHKLNHEAKSQFLCTQCQATFSREDLWRRHLRVSHSIIVQQSKQSVPSLVVSGSDVSRTSMQATSEEGQSSRVPTGLMVNKAGNHQDSSTHASLLRTSLESNEKPIYGSTIGIQCSHSVPVSLDTMRNETTVETSISSQSQILQTYQSKSFLQEPQDLDWSSGLDARNVAYITDDDISWLFDDASFARFGSSTSEMFPTTELGSMALNIRGSPFSEAGDVGHIILNTLTESAKPLVEAPSCGYRICNALTDVHREGLIAAVKPQLMTLSFDDQVFSLENLKQGVHLYARYISKEFALFNHRIFAPAEDEQEDFKQYYGEDPPLELTWAIITLGWTLYEPKNEYQTKAAGLIQGVLRKFVITHSAFTLTPPLWIIQLLFLVLVFARYQGPEEEYSFAIFHGVLISAVRRLDLTITSQYVAHPINTNIPRQEWLKWIRAETLRRVVFQTFILDVQQAVLHGGDSSMSPFQLNLELPCCDKAWWSNTVEEWRSALAEEAPGSQRFLPVLKQFWNSSAAKNQPPYSYPRDSKVIMYGIISIASEMRRREDNSFSLTPKENLVSLSSRLQNSFEGWVAWWGSNLINFGLETFSFWRNCCCVFKVAHTLYEISAVDLQMLAGKEVIEGVRMRPPDYAKSQRKIRRWAKQEYALVGISYAAKIIEDRLSASHSPHLHCHHCQWILYLASLICWAFGFTVTGSMQNTELVQKGDVISADLARQQCMEYLSVATKLPASGLTSMGSQVNKTTGLLITITAILRQEKGSGLIAEAVDVLMRLVGIQAKP